MYDRDVHVCGCIPISFNAYESSKPDQAARATLPCRRGISPCLRDCLPSRSVRRLIICIAHLYILFIFYSTYM